jgi:hypothetical protein
MDDGTGTERLMKAGAFFCGPSGHERLGRDQPHVSLHILGSEDYQRLLTGAPPIRASEQFAGLDACALEQGSACGGEDAVAVRRREVDGAVNLEHVVATGRVAGDVDAGEIDADRGGGAQRDRTHGRRGIDAAPLCA